MKKLDDISTGPERPSHPPDGRTGSRVQRSRGRRRPSGERPPLPRNLRRSGKYWLVLALAVAAAWIVILTVEGAGLLLGRRLDLPVLEAVEKVRNDALTPVMQKLNALGSDWTVRVLRWGALLALLALKRFRHFFVFLGSILAVAVITTLAALAITRPRPLGIDILAPWQGPAHPSRPMAVLAVTLIGVVYTLVVPGRARSAAKWITGVVLVVLAFVRLYLAVDHPNDILVGVILGVAIPLVAFRALVPNEIFPVTYGRRRASAHLDVKGERGRAIKDALEEQLGISVIEAKPFGLAGSGGSTPLRLRVAGESDTYLFGKLYAINHLRADRWYKLGRTLLYGRLEDEGSFSTVRRLVQYEDYMLRVMRDAELPTPDPYGFAEISPEREYLLVTSFVEAAQELLEAEVDVELIDDCLALVRKLWDAGLAHRDVKPSNLLVSEGRVHLIDVAFGQVRPSPWRQAVDLANMMLVLAFRSDADLVYERACRFFTPDEIAEAFAATRAVTMPSQSRRILKQQRRNLLARFRELAPTRRPISIQRWSWRRVALTTTVVITALVCGSLVVGNLGAAGLTSAYEAPVLKAPECRETSDQLILMAQSVPSATRIPCIRSLPLGWGFVEMDVRRGSSTIALSSDRAGLLAVEVKLQAGCETDGATRVPSDEPGVRQFERIPPSFDRYSGTRYFVFEGGCVTYEFDFSGEGRTALAQEVSVGLGFFERTVIREDLESLGVSL